jgi:small subunit ribosomal protein S6
MEEEGLEAVKSKVNEAINANGGQVKEVDVWGKRRLAYPIQRLREGYYIVNRVQLEPKAIKEVERSLKLSEEVIRYLLVRI